MIYEYDDGGRKAAGFKGDTRDCVCRAIAIAMNRPYREVYDELMRLYAVKNPRTRRHRSSKRYPARRGLFLSKLRDYLELRYFWTHIDPWDHDFMLLGDEPPAFPVMIVGIKRHVFTIKHGVLRDTWNPITQSKGRRSGRVITHLWIPPAPERAQYDEQNGHRTETLLCPTGSENHDRRME